MANLFRFRQCGVLTLIIALILIPAVALPSAVQATTTFPAIEAESYATVSSTSIMKADNYNADGGTYVHGIQNGDFVSYNNVALGSGMASVMVRIATPKDGGTLELHLDSATGPRIGTLAIPNTHGWAVRDLLDYSNGWRTVTTSLSGATGTHSVFLVFSNPGGGEVAQIDWFRFMNPTSPQVYYVATNGNDSNSGTSINSPFRTISKAVSLLLPGDTVLIRGGQYNELVIVKPINSGTATNRVTIEAYAGETPIIDGTGLTMGDENTPLLRGRADYVTYSGLTLQNSQGRGFSGDGDFVQLEHSRIATTWNAGVLFIEQTGSSFIDNEIWDTGRKNLPPGVMQGGWQGALQGNDAYDITISANVIHDNHGEGIISGVGTYRFNIAYNSVYDNWSVGIYLDNAHDDIVEQNLIFETETSYKPRSQANWREIESAIGVADEDAYEESNHARTSFGCGKPQFEPGGGHTIRNNFAVNTRQGFNFGSQYIVCSGVKNTLVVNNTFVDQWEEAIRLVATDPPYTDHVGAVFRNNLLHSKGSSDSGGRLLTVLSKNDTLFENNLFYATGITSPHPFVWSATNSYNDSYSFDAWETPSNPNDNTRNDLWADPRLVMLGSLSGSISANHKLTAASPAINAGSATNAPTTDYWGTLRPQGSAVDIGAHEYTP